jgi:hypothetical protein
MHLISAHLPILPVFGVKTLCVIHPWGGVYLGTGGGATMGWQSGITITYLGVGVCICFLSGQPRSVA